MNILSLYSKTDLDVTNPMLQQHFGCKWMLYIHDIQLIRQHQNPKNTLFIISEDLFSQPQENPFHQHDLHEILTSKQYWIIINCPIDAFANSNIPQSMIDQIFVFDFNNTILKKLYLQLGFISRYSFSEFKHLVCQIIDDTLPIERNALVIQHQQLFYFRSNL